MCTQTHSWTLSVDCGDISAVRFCWESKKQTTQAQLKELPFSYLLYSCRRANRQKPMLILIWDFRNKTWLECLLMKLQHMTRLFRIMHHSLLLQGRFLKLCLAVTTTHSEPAEGRCLACVSSSLQGASLELYHVLRYFESFQNREGKRGDFLMH